MSITKNGSSSTSRVSRKRSFSSTTAFNSIAGNSTLTTTTTTNSMDLSTVDKTTVVTNNNESKKTKSNDQGKVDYYTTTTTRRRRQVVTDKSRTTTTTTNITKGTRRSSSQRSIPAFLHKLYNMVNDLSTIQYIRWSNDGNSFLVEDHEKFAELVLPRFYKHNTFASFVRQLNMYDFHKIPHIQQGVLITANDTENELWEFSHSNFKRDRSDLLILIARKRNRDRNKTADMDNMNLSSVIKEISAIKKHQTNITADLKKLRKDNETIWKETLIARENHLKHQEVISKILQFLTAVFSNDFPQLNNGVINNQLEKLKQLQEPIEQTDSSCEQDYYLSSSKIDFLSSKVNSAEIISSDSTYTSGSDNEMDDDYEMNNSDNEFMESDRMQELSPKMTNNAETQNVHLPYTQTDMTENYNNNYFGDMRNKKTTASSSYNTSLSHNGSEVYNHTSRSAQAITNDIKELQDDVETLVVQLGIDPTHFPDKQTDFGDLSSNYNDMISSASQNDKLRLFKLANNTESAQVSPQMQTSAQFVPSSDTKSLHQQTTLSPQQNFHSSNQVHTETNTSTSHASDNNSLANFFCQLLKSVDPYHADLPYSCVRGTASVPANDTIKPQNFYQSSINSCTTPKMNMPPVETMPKYPSTMNQVHNHPTVSKNNMYTTIPSTKNSTNLKQTYQAENHNEQVDQLFRSAVLIQQRIQSGKNLPLQLPRNHSNGQSSSYNQQTPNYQASFDTMINNTMSSHQPHHSFQSSQHL